MRQAGLLHDVSDADAGVAVAPNRTCGDVDDVLVRVLLAGVGRARHEGHIILWISYYGAAGLSRGPARVCRRGAASESPPWTESSVDLRSSLNVQRGERRLCGKSRRLSQGPKVAGQRRYERLLSSPDASIASFRGIAVARPTQECYPSVRPERTVTDVPERTIMLCGSSPSGQRGVARGRRAETDTRHGRRAR